MSNKVLDLRAIVVAGLLLLSQAGCIWFEVTDEANSCRPEGFTGMAAFARRHATAVAKGSKRTRRSTAKVTTRAGRSQSRSQSRRAKTSRSRGGARSSRTTTRSRHGRVSKSNHRITHVRHVSHASHISHTHSSWQTKFVAPPDAGAPVDFGIAPRARNYALLSRAYNLYDQGVNEKLRGNYGAATDKLSESVSLIDQARSNQHGGVPSTLESMVFYELGEAAEADGDVILARDSYAHCLRAKSDFVEAYLHIVNLLASQGQLPLAASWIKEGLQECPHDPRINELSTQLSTYVGAAGTDLAAPTKTLQGPPEPENAGE